MSNTEFLQARCGWDMLFGKIIYNDWPNCVTIRLSRRSNEKGVKIGGSRDAAVSTGDTEDPVKSMETTGPHTLKGR